jgi:hypothetical protein
MYAEAAVDGSDATIWAPAEATAALTADLRSKKQVGGIAVHWTDTLPASSRIEASADGKTWTVVSPAPDENGTLGSPVTARYVRVTMTRAGGAARTGIREVEVTPPAP